jgi:hypothetical protein
MFGLLTPSLPNFADFNSKTISIEDNNASHVCEETNAIQRLNDADTMTIDMTEQADTDLANVLEEPQENRLAQQQPACSDVVEVDEEEDSEADELIHTQYDRMQREIRDAQLAAELGVSHTTSGTRRSTRLAMKDNVKGGLFQFASYTLTLMLTLSSQNPTPLSTFQSPPRRPRQL